MSMLPRVALVLVPALALPLVACIDDAPSLHPLFASSETLAPSAIEGDWVVQGDPGNRLHVEAVGDHYEFGAPEEDCRSGDSRECLLKLRVVFGRLSHERFLDYTAGDGLIGAIPVHGFARVRLSADRFELAALKGEWLAERIKTGQIALAHELLDGRVLITDGTPELQQVFTEWAFDEGAFEEPTIYVRPGAVPAGQ